MLELVNSKETYDRVYELKDTPIEQCPVFSLKKLTMAEVNSINDRLTMSTGQGQLLFLGGTGNTLKIKYSVVSWKNVTVDGKEVPCNDKTKELLPPDVALWLEKEIDKLNGFQGIGEEERKN